MPINAIVNNNRLDIWARWKHTSQKEGRTSGHNILDFSWLHTTAINQILSLVVSCTTEMSPKPIQTVLGMDRTELWGYIYRPLGISWGLFVCSAQTQLGYFIQSRQNHSNFNSDSHLPNSFPRERAFPKSQLFTGNDVRIGNTWRVTQELCSGV